MQDLTNVVKTMLSTEIVKIINDMREEGSAILEHSDFMKKVVKVLGAEGAGKFSASYLSLQNKSLPCYALPKREANLMVMSESYKVQAAVYDKMVELEAQTTPLPTPMTTNEVLAQAILGMVAMEKNHNQLADEVRKLELKVESLAGRSTATKKEYLTPQELGKLFYPNLSAHKINAMLMDSELQENIGVWIMTDKGKQYGTYCMISDAAHCKRLKWDKSVLEAI